MVAMVREVMMGTAPVEVTLREELMAVPQVASGSPCIPVEDVEVAPRVAGDGRPLPVMNSRNFVNIQHRVMLLKFPIVLY